MPIQSFYQLYKDENYTFFPVIHSACDREITVNNDQKLINFGSCDYLGLANDVRLKNAAKEAIDLLGTNISGSVLMSGYTCLHKKFEQELAKMFKGYYALMFTTSFLGNLGTISSILSSQDVVILDKLSHSCLIQGSILSRATIRSYPHGDMNKLEELLKRYRDTKKVVITDGVFSADGDLANLQSIVSLCKQYNAISYVDDAHGVGVLGDNGCGLVEQCNLLGEIDVLSGTMSKAFGSTGGFILLKDEKFYNKIRHVCASYTSSRSVSPGVVGASLQALEINKLEGQVRRKRVLELSRMMVSLLKQNNFETLNTETPIIPIVFNDINLTGKITKELMNLGFLVSHFLFPYVQKNKARLRIGVSYNHSEEDIIQFVDTLSKITTYHGT